MAERTVAVGLIAYTPADAPHLSLWGQHGAVVDVHSDDIERFDSLNGTPAAPPSASLSVDEHPAADGNAAPAVPPGSPQHPGLRRSRGVTVGRRRDDRR